MDNIERRANTGDVEIRSEGDGTLTAEGYAAVFNVRSENLGGFVEVISKNAFRETLKTQDVLGLFNHDMNLLLGRTSNGTLSLHEDDHGLRYSLKLPDTSVGRDVAELLRSRTITGSSFGFNTISDSWSETESGYPERRLLEARLIDISPVSRPAYPQTEASLRSLVDVTGQDIETILKAAEQNELRSLISQDDDEDEEEAPSATQANLVRRSWAIR